MNNRPNDLVFGGFVFLIAVTVLLASAVFFVGPSIEGMTQ